MSKTTKAAVLEKYPTADYMRCECGRGRIAVRLGQNVYEYLSFNLESEDLAWQDAWDRLYKQ